MEPSIRQRLIATFLRNRSEQKAMLDWADKHNARTWINGREVTEETKERSRFWISWYNRALKKLRRDAERT